MASKQTAVEWLVDWIGKNQYFIGNDLLKAFEQAKAMEEKEIVENFNKGMEYGIKLMKTTTRQV